MNKVSGFTVNDYIKTHKIKVFIWLLFTAGISFAAPLKAFILQWIIDSRSKYEAIQYLCLGVVLILASYLLESLCRNTFTGMICKSVELIRERILHKILCRSMVDYEKEEDASYISILTTDLRILYDDYFTSIFNIVFGGGIMLCALGMYVYISPLMLLVVAVAAVAPLVVPKVLNQKLKLAREKFSLEMSKYTQSLKEILAGFETIHLLGVKKQYEDLHKDVTEENIRSEHHFQRIMNLTVTTTSLLSNATFIVILLIGMFLVFDDRISMGYMVTASSLANFVMSPCTIISQNYARLKATKSIRDRIEQMLDPSECSDKEMEHLGPMDSISFKNVKFTYPDASEPVLKGITLDIKPCEKIALTGKSGCGKSTLAKLLCRYYPSYEGEIFAGSSEIRRIRTEALYEHVGYISQKTFLFNDSIRNNICLYQSFTDEQLENAIQAAGLHDYIALLPEGLDTRISENGKNLSGGQIQRIGIARLVLRSYQLIIADEITANLDEITANAVMENLLHQDCMVIAITHDTQNEYMKYFDRMITLEGGR